MLPHTVFNIVNKDEVLLSIWNCVIIFWSSLLVTVGWGEHSVQLTKSIINWLLIYDIHIHDMCCTTVTSQSILHSNKPIGFRICKYTKCINELLKCIVELDLCKIIIKLNMCWAGAPFLSPHLLLPFSLITILDGIVFTKLLE